MSGPSCPNFLPELPQYIVGLQAPGSADCMKLVFVNRTMCLGTFDRWVADEWTYNRNMTCNRTDNGTGSDLDGCGPRHTPP